MVDQIWRSSSITGTSDADGNGRPVASPAMAAHPRGPLCLLPLQSSPSPSPSPSPSSSPPVPKHDADPDRTDAFFQRGRRHACHAASSHSSGALRWGPTWWAPKLVVGPPPPPKSPSKAILPPAPPLRLRRAEKLFAPKLEVN
ncbi:hypothetical protein NL676_017700 [Syzygium grande]|nr:hypothetical protein NL676_017700 [Syzygium grande]